MTADGVIITEQIVLATDADGSPVAVGFLLGFVDGVGTEAGFLGPILGLVPMRVTIGSRLARGLGSIVDGRSLDLKTLQTIGANGATRQGRVPGTLAGVDRAPVFVDDVKFAILVADDRAVGAVGRMSG